MNMGKTKVMRISMEPTHYKLGEIRNNWKMWNVSNIWVA
jgi:hypothetical protein